MYKSSSTLKQKRFERKVKKFLFFKFFPFFVLIILFVFLFNSPQMSIKKVNIEFTENKNIYIDKIIILQQVDDILNQVYFSSLSKNNFIFFPRDEIEKKLKKEFPEILDLTISWGEWFKDIRISISEEKKQFVYCNSKDEFFDVNKEGKIFYKKDLLKEKEEEKFLILKSKKDLLNGEKYFSSFNKSEKVLSLISKIGKKVSIKYFIKENKFSNILIMEDETKILLNSDFDENKISFKLNKLFTQDDFKIEKGNFVKKIDYINLTLEDKIFYCLKGEVCENSY